MEEKLRKWRLILGKQSNPAEDIELSSEMQGMDDVLDALYDSEKEGGLGSWIFRICTQPVNPSDQEAAVSESLIWNHDTLYAKIVHADSSMSVCPNRPNGIMQNVQRKERAREGKKYLNLILVLTPKFYILWMEPPPHVYCHWST